MKSPSWQRLNQKNSRRLKKRLLTLIFILVMLGVAVSFAIDIFLRPVFIAEAEMKAIQLTTQAISQAVYDQAKQLQYTEMIHYQTNQQGDIILMQPDLQRVNEFTSQVILAIQSKLSLMAEEWITIPIAHALGLQLLAGVGPKVKVQMIPVGLVKPPEILDDFESAGINQTRHKIYMKVTAEVQLLIPFIRRRMQIETQVPVTEVTIMGKVPDIYIGFGSGVIGETSINQLQNLMQDKK